MTIAPETEPRAATSAECRALLERVINSRELKRALRLRELLAYLGQRALKPQAAPVREQEIGACVFGRAEAYDTSLDNIVRVNVSELRKRLAHYFLDEGADEAIGMEIPRGAYVPVYFSRLAEAKQPVDLVSVPAIPIEEAALEELAAPLEAQDRPESMPALFAHISPVKVLAVALCLALVACAALGWEAYKLQAQVQPWNAEPVRAALWSEFFGAGDEVDIVTADTSFALAEDVLGRPISLDDYVNYRYKSFADDPALTPDKHTALTLILDRNNGSIGDFQAAQKFIDLAGHSPTVKLAGARSYTPETIKNNNVILVGGRVSNPWVDLYKSRTNFTLEYNPGTQRSLIVNHNPRPGERAVYEASEQRNQGYSVVSFLPNLNANHYTLIISGSDSQATLAAGEFVTSSEGLAQIHQKAPAGRFPFFELVLGSSRMVGTTLDITVVASRIYPR